MKTQSNFFYKAIELDPNYSSAYSNKGFALRKLNRLEEALNVFDKSIELDSNISNKGGALVYLDKYEDAIQCLDKAIELDPIYFLTYYNKGLILQKLNCFEALQSYDKAIELNPNFSEAIEYTHVI
jgi:tetratricopeptide (TPR) repeat protein